MPPRDKILVITTNEALGALLAEQFAVHTEFALVDKQATDPAVIILDATSYDAPQAMCQTMRTTNPAAVLIAVVDDDEMGARLRDAGAADDDVMRPIRFGVLLAQVRHHLQQRKKHQAKQNAVWRIGCYQFYPARKMLEADDGRTIRLTEKEVGILQYLYQAANIVPRETLLHEVWGYQQGVSTHTLETHIYRLRQKIEDDPTRARLLMTQAGGYRLMP